MVERKNLLILSAGVVVGFTVVLAQRFLLKHGSPLRAEIISLVTTSNSIDATVLTASHNYEVTGTVSYMSFWLRETSIRSASVNCARIISGDAKEMNKSYELMSGRKAVELVPFFSILKATKDCKYFIQRREYVTHYGSQEELKFPIAYSILVYRDFAQVERLLRAIYRPQNVYCIHYDNKSAEVFKENLRELVSCFSNVHVASSNLLVRWGYFSALQADLICMKDLLQYRSWKYLINLTGQEFPLKTNLQIVKILKSYRGANDVSGSLAQRDDKRIRKKDEPPHNITVLKGPVHIAASRAFIEFMFSNEKARDFLKWVKGTQVPDETYFPTLQNNPALGAPGAFGGGLELMEKKVSRIRYKLWYWSSDKCHGKRVRLVCVFNIGDLPNLTKAKELFANKFHLAYGQHAYDCLEEWHRNRTRDEYFGLYKFDVSEYSELPFVKYRTNLS